MTRQGGVSGGRQNSARGEGMNRNGLIQLEIRTLVALCVASCPLLFAGRAAGRQISAISRPNLWVTNGTVYSIAESCGTIYLGGTFSYVGPPTGSFVAIDTATGQWNPVLARVNSWVNAVAADGAGGWYIGGGFI